MSALSRRRIDVTIQLGKGQWGEDKGDTMVLTGYRVHAEMEQLYGYASSQAQVLIYGLPVDTLNRATNLARVLGSIRMLDRVTVTAGDDEGAMNTFFTGTIREAWAQMQDAPNTCLAIVAQSSLDIAMKSVPASSYVGDVQVSKVMSDLANEAGYAFENNGVNGVLRSPVFNGTTLTKIRACARAARIFCTTDNNTVAIWPTDGSRKQAAVPTFSPGNGMIGYPVYSNQGVTIRTLATNEIAVGTKFAVSGSLLTAANSTWTALRIHHSIESQTPNGAWMTEILAARGLGVENDESN